MSESITPRQGMLLSAVVRAEMLTMARAIWPEEHAAHLPEGLALSYEPDDNPINDVISVGTPSIELIEVRYSPFAVDGVYAALCAMFEAKRAVEAPPLPLEELAPAGPPRLDLRPPAKEPSELAREAAHDPAATQAAGLPPRFCTESWDEGYSAAKARLDSTKGTDDVEQQMKNQLRAAYVRGRDGVLKALEELPQELRRLHRVPMFQGADFEQAAAIIERVILECKTRLK